MKIKSTIVLSVAMVLSYSAVGSQERNQKSVNIQISQPVIEKHNDNRMRHRDHKVRQNNSMFLTERKHKPVLPVILDPNYHEDDYFFNRQGPTIQVAILLDTSGSMNGLINQARLKIWDIINEISKANKDNKSIILEVALYEYGTSNGNEHTGFVKRLNGLTGDLDLLSENLFNLETSGSKEYSGVAIKKAVDDLAWSDHPNDLKLIIIAGNEEFRQGFTPYEYAIGKASQSDIIVNTIYCGDRNSGIDNEWLKAAKLGGGKFLNINQDERVSNITTPYDDEINNLGVSLNSTYVRYGELGDYKKQRQITQDKLSESVSSSYMTSRNLAKSSKSYNTSDWDLVDKFDRNNDEAIELAIESSSEMDGLSNIEVKEKLTLKLEQRKEIQSKMKVLESKRERYIEDNQKNSESNFGSVLLDAVKEQAEDKGYTFK